MSDPNIDVADEAGESVDLLRHLIRNACVNDGTPESGGESRSAELLADFLGTAGLDVERRGELEGRDSLIARIEGSDPKAPTMVWLGHTDVVPVNEDRWLHDPFGGEIIDGVVWGRGAVDMLNLTASMAVAFKRLANSGFVPDGTLVYIGVADEEAAGVHGAGYLVENHWEAVAGDYVITESGGIPIHTPAGIKLPVIVGEKGAFWCRLTVSGTPGHASQPYRTDNALVKAAKVTQRLAEYVPETQIHDVFRRFVESLGFPDDFTAPLLSPDTFADALEVLPVGMARQFHACTHTTIAPTVVQGGAKTNMIPDRVELDVDMRTLPGQTHEEVEAMLIDALGDLADEVSITPLVDDEATQSPIETPLWDLLSSVTQRWYPGSETVPYLSVGATDARFYRRRDSVSYGFGLFSEHMNLEDYGTMFHGDDERIDVDSMGLSTQLFEMIARQSLT